MIKRKSVLELKKVVYLTEESHIKLQKLKRKLKKSMAQILIDLIQKKYDETL